MGQKMNRENNTSKQSPPVMNTVRNRQAKRYLLKDLNNNPYQKHANDHQQRAANTEEITRRRRSHAWVAALVDSTTLGKALLLECTPEQVVAQKA